ncbi:hypothetical protein [Cytobacillus purgationiresistens]|uniref:Uncharacterized protein n=1 Tax=Cytobacillus purgationiresistens TaxID=863449 RepID=A0ABU0AIL8_9BACI|nr:hypothetical protein [Cytobacillus purgationiresistens]MDQ0270622.1 hypothetical protein [Cytobacillus purgationiresistens]
MNVLNLTINEKDQVSKDDAGRFQHVYRTGLCSCYSYKGCEVLWDELRDLSLDESWLKTKLSSQSIFEYSKAEWLEGDGLFAQLIEQIDK